MSVKHNESARAHQVIFISVSSKGEFLKKWVMLQKAMRAPREFPVKLRPLSVAFFLLPTILFSF